MATLRSLWLGIRERWRLTVINQKEDVSWACRASVQSRLRNGNSPQSDGEQYKKGIGAACGKLFWGPAEGRPGDQRGGKTQDRS